MDTSDEESDEASRRLFKGFAGDCEEVNEGETRLVKIQVVNIEDNDNFEGVVCVVEEAGENGFVRAASSKDVPGGFVLRAVKLIFAGLEGLRIKGSIVSRACATNANTARRMNIPTPACTFIYLSMKGGGIDIEWVVNIGQQVF